MPWMQLLSGRAAGLRVSDHDSRKYTDQYHKLHLRKGQSHQPPVGSDDSVTMAVLVVEDELPTSVKAQMVNV